MDEKEAEQHLLLELLINAQGLIGEGRWQEASVRINDARRVLETTTPKPKKKATRKEIRPNYLG